MEKNEVDAILGPADSGPAEEDGCDELEMVSQELIEAVHARNAADVAAALKAAFACLDKDDEGAS